MVKYMNLMVLDREGMMSLNDFSSLIDRAYFFLLGQFDQSQLSIACKDENEER